MSVLVLLAAVLAGTGCRAEDLQPTDPSRTSLNLVVITPKDTLPSTCDDLQLEVPPRSGRGDGAATAALDAVQLALDHVNGDCTILQDYHLTFTNFSLPSVSHIASSPVLFLDSHQRGGKKKEPGTH